MPGEPGRYPAIDFRNVISKDDMMARLVDACPSFEPQWKRFVDEWRDDDELPLYISLGDFAQHLIDMLASQPGTNNRMG